ncbi:bifunctional metallophosphatase/5'-nucleotidase [Gulosibacter sp. ACHW.36C]|uniref:Bifunctional metallophosphatase/5'-nucleotidase n=1 Tax=Gulosibacter sediminis TaxID=1729695 RepID=A0ABY4MVJ3_9MICO|nr:5'-nucleotidase C-terminal domain-containing protein [Gulosibacter sediminis]UQN14059.1 bifunctional metallophosphatase/5'-nucleotidase [Gulosibacter sediminis]
MRVASKLSALLATAALVAAGTPAVAQAASPMAQTVNEDGTVTVQLITVNDVHGRIGAMTVPWAGTIEQARAENPDSVLISAGDNQGASLFASSIANDEPIMDVLNTVGVDAIAAGNHEFDKGLADVERIEEYLGQSLLAANIYDEAGNTVLDSYKIVERGGLRIGVIGTAPEDLATLVSAEAFDGLQVGDAVEAVNRVAAEIEDDVDLIVADFHDGATAGEPEGATWDSERAKPGLIQQIDTELTPAVDVVLNAHTHRVYNWTDTVEETGATRPVIQTGEYMNNIGVIEVTYDPASGEVVDFTSELRARTTTPTDELIATYPVVAEVNDIVNDALADAEVLGGVPVGNITTDITREGVAAEDTSYPGESALGNLVTDMMVQEGEQYGAQIGMGNAGGVRADLLYGEDGVVSYSELQAVMPFVNNQFVVELTGEQVRTLIEQQFREDGSYTHISFSSNLTYTYDPEAEFGNKVSDVYFEGALIDPDEVYSIITYGFLASGTTGFPVFQDAISKTDTGRIDLDMFRDAFADSLEGDAIAPDFSRRSVQLTGAPDAPVAAGEQVTFALGDLDLTSAGTPLASEITGTLVTADGTRIELGSFTAVDGAADISFALPEADAGDATIELEVADAGTLVRVPLTVEAGAEPTPAPTASTPAETEQATDGPETTAPGASASATSTSTAAADGSDDSLATTGAQVLPLGLLAAATVVLGAVLVLRRRTQA